jgi:hypothetical protein
MTEETTEKIDAEPKEVRNFKCIFGENYRNPCPVRQELSARQPKADLSKYIKSTIPAMDEAKALMFQFADLLSEEYKSLVSFCAVCPFIKPIPQLIYQPSPLWQPSVTLPTVNYP